MLTSSMISTSAWAPTCWAQLDNSLAPGRLRMSSLQRIRIQDPGRQTIGSGISFTGSLPIVKSRMRYPERCTDIDTSRQSQEFLSMDRNADSSIQMRPAPKVTVDKLGA